MYVLERWKGGREEREKGGREEKAGGRKRRKGGKMVRWEGGRTDQHECLKSRRKSVGVLHVGKKGRRRVNGRRVSGKKMDTRHVRKEKNGRVVLKNTG
jgi:hypothetical protein